MCGDALCKVTNTHLVGSWPHAHRSVRREVGADQVVATHNGAQRCFNAAAGVPSNGVVDVTAGRQSVADADQCAWRRR